MSEGGVVGPIGAILLFIFFIINWFVWLGKWVNEVGARAVAEGGLNGVEAFFYGNINLFVMVFIVLGIMGFMYFRAE